MCANERVIALEAKCDLLAASLTKQDTEVARLKDFGKYEAFGVGYEAALEEAAKVAESYEPECESCPRGVANAIRVLLRGGEE